MRIQKTTLLFLRDENRILLALKKRGFGKDKYNGVGGKVELGETPEEAMLRETEEEIGVTPIKYEKVGLIDFVEFVKGEKMNVNMHVFVSSKWKGEPTESEEMKPKWFDISDVPYSQMFEDDKYWLPFVLQNKKIKANFEFDENWELLSHKIEETH